MRFLSNTTRKCDTVLQSILSKNPILLDVRTHTEFAGYHLPNARNISMSEIPYSIQEIKEWNRPVIVYSANGLRSKLTCQILKRAGIQVYNAGSQRHVASLMNLG